MNHTPQSDHIIREPLHRIVAPLIRKCGFEDLAVRIESAQTMSEISAACRAVVDAGYGDEGSHTAAGTVVCIDDADCVPATKADIVGYVMSGAARVAAAVVAAISGSGAQETVIKAVVSIGGEQEMNAIIFEANHARIQT